MSDYRRVKVVVVLIGSGDNMADDPEKMLVPIEKDIVVDSDMPLKELGEVFENAIRHIEDEN